MNLKEEYIRLVDSVKNHLKQQGKPHRDEDVAKLLGHGKSHFATLVGKTGKVTDKHLKEIKLHFPEIFENQTNHLNGNKKGSEITLPVNQYEFAVLLHRVAFLMSKVTGDSEVVELGRIKKDAQLLREMGS